MSPPALEGAPTNWGAPLGLGLPPAGAPEFRLWPYVAGGLLSLAILGTGGCFAYPFVLPPAALAARVSHHESLRDAALAWRAEYAKSAGVASKIEVWRRGAFEASCCGRVVPADTDAGEFILVLPLSDGAGTETPQDQQVLRPPAEAWAPSLQVLSDQVQFADLGNEPLVRATVLVSLSSKPSGAATLVASADSPPGGTPNTGAVNAVPFAGCLPTLPAEDASIRLASPPGQPSDGAYWVAWRGENGSLLRVAPCSAAPAVPLEVRRFSIPAGYRPLLTFLRSPTPTPLVLQLAPEGQSAPRLLRPSAVQDQLEVIGEVTSEGIGQSGGKPLAGARLFDSFQPGLPGSGPGGAETPARYESEVGVRHLVPNGGRWVFAPCTNPTPDRYLVVDDACGERGGEYLTLERSVIEGLSDCSTALEPRLGAFDDSLGSGGKSLRSREQCIAAAYYALPGLEDTTCNLSVTPAPCAAGSGH